MEKVKMWIDKALNDLKIAEYLIKTDEIIPDGVCFHCQQAVEKFLKAYLIYKGVPFRKTHDIAELIILCIDVDKDFEMLKNRSISELTVYATKLRYPDFLYSPSVEEAEEAVKKAKFVREFVMGKMEL